MDKVIELEADYKSKLLKLLESAISIEINEKEGNKKVVYVKKGIEQYMEGMNDKIKG